MRLLLHARAKVRCKLAAPSFALALTLFAPEAQAQLGKDGAKTTNSNYTIDLYEGPVLAGARVIGIGGAYAPIAEGVAGYVFNPAAAAQRVPWSTDWFDWDIDGGITLPSSLTGNDFDNNGDDSFTNKAAVFLTGGLGFQFGDIGVGATVDLNLYRVVSQGAGGENLTLNISIVRGLLVVAYSFLDGELIAGLGVSANNLEIAQPVNEGGTTQERKLATVTGPAAHVGALWAPAWLPLRMGASVRYSLAANAVPEVVEPDAAGNYVIGSYYLPNKLALPTEIHAGIAVQLFRPMNFRWVNPHDEDSPTQRTKRENKQEREKREQEAERRIEEAKSAGKDVDVLKDQIEKEEEVAEAQEEAKLDKAKQADRERRKRTYRMMPREKLLASVAVKVTAPTKDGVGLESFLRQEVERSGTVWSWSPRVGLEGEVIPGYLVLRAGSYYEPTRFANSSFRIHGTGGLDIHIPIEWSVFGLLDDDTTFRVGGALDGADRYFGWSVTAGLWH